MFGIRSLRIALFVPLLVAAAAAVATRSAADETAPSARPSSIETALIDQLRVRVEQQAAALDGVAGVYVEDLTSGATIAICADASFAQASVIKVPILFELLARADEKTIDLDRRTRRPVASGMGGILENLSPVAELSARDLAVLMIVQSDNGAANELIDRLGMERVTARMAALGLPHTLLRRKMLDTAAARAGRENVSTPREMATLAKRIHDGGGLSAAGAAELRRLLGIWSSDRFRNGVGEGAGAAIFGKSGELPGVRTVVALVELPKRAYVAAIATAALRDDVDGDTFVTALSRALFETFERLSRMNADGRFVD